MAFELPNDPDAEVNGAAYPQQAQPDKVDIDILVAGYQGTGVSSGCGVTAQGSPNMSVAVAAGTVEVTGTPGAVAGGTVALLAPTRYLGPFEGVVVEAAMTGTPAVTTDFGAFVETVKDGVTGFRCHTLAEFCQAVADAPLLDRTAIRERAVRLYSLDAAAGAYSRWFRRLETLKAGGWYEDAPPVLR